MRQHHCRRARNTSISAQANVTTGITTRTAQCSCGQLQVEVQGEPLRVSICHCLACQRRTGSVFGEQARFPSSGFKVIGRSIEYVRVGDEGTKITFRFCPACGATVYYTAAGAESLIAVPVGAFADPEFRSPTVSVYECRKHAWVQVPVEFAREP
jgi:hypothetical protein